jgi:hypothetical protein
LPGRAPPPSVRPVPASAPAEPALAIPGLAVAVTAVQDPITRAAQAVSILRLAAPQLPARAEAALATAEEALETAIHRVGALAVAGHGGGARRPIDLAGLVEDLVATFPPPPGVRLRFELAVARALADDRPVRAAVRALLAAACAGLPAGGEIEVAVRSAGPSALVELRSGGELAPGGLALARALVAGQGGRVEQEAVPGRGSLVRLALERAAALEPA